MTIHPTLAALRKHKSGVILICMQIAFTLAIVCNILFIVSIRVQRIQRPTGLVEAPLFLIDQSYVNSQATPNADADTALDARQLSDLSALRGLSDVASAAPVNSLPLLRYDSIQDIAIAPSQANGLTQASFFFSDQHLLSTFGLQLLAGRNFTSSEVHPRSANDHIAPSVVIVTKALADQLYPHGDALGKAIYVNNNSEPTRVIGIVARLLTSEADGTDAHAWNSVIVPARIDAASTMYAVRARDGRVDEAMKEAKSALFKIDPMRIIEEHGRYSPSGVHTYKQIRDMGYALDEFMVQVLTAICGVLLAITAVGMAGLTSFWVSQRYRQIGIRRALGARKIDVMRYFQVENLFIASAGCFIGALLAIAINLVLLKLFELERMPLWYVFAGIVVIQLLGQVAVLIPAWRASLVPPVVATRAL